MNLPMTSRLENSRPRTYDDSTRRMIVAAVAARMTMGETLNSIFADKASGMPNRESFRNWVKQDAQLMAIYRAARRSSPRYRNIGQPMRYLPAIGEVICDLLLEGWSLRQICQRVGMPSQGTVYRWLDRHDDFARMYARAREGYAHRLFDEAMEVADTATESSWRRAKLKIDTIRWTVAKLAPHRYGAKPKTPEDAPKRPVWNIYVQKFGAPEETAELVQSYEIDPKGGIYEPDEDL